MTIQKTLCSPKSNNYNIVYALTNPTMSDMVKTPMTNRNTTEIRTKNFFEGK